MVVLVVVGGTGDTGGGRVPNIQYRWRYGRWHGRWHVFRDVSEAGIPERDPGGGGIRMVVLGRRSLSVSAARALSIWALLNMFFASVFDRIVKWWSVVEPVLLRRRLAPHPPARCPPRAPPESASTSTSSSKLPAIIGLTTSTGSPPGWRSSSAYVSSYESCDQRYLARGGWPPRTSIS